MSAALPRAIASAAALAAILSALAGCQALGALSTSASMQVEVDVYKGPLNNGRTGQLGELTAMFDEAQVLLGIFASHAEARAHAPTVGDYDAAQLLNAANRAKEIQAEMRQFPPPTRDDSRNGQTARDAGLPALNEAAACMTSAAPCPDRKTSENAIHVATMQATRIATQLKVEAFYWSETQIGKMTTDQEVRSMLVNYINLASELSNQISARTDVLAKQLDTRTTGTMLALSDHLKDAGPTDFLHLYEWYNATQQDDSGTSLTPADRARLARHLFSDHYWTHINDVHASGQGEVRMALVKDDIGNWSLKSFDSDPEDLLKAYRNLTFAGIEGAIKAGKAIADHGAGAGLDIASQFARGRLGSNETAAASSQRIDAMRIRAEADLKALQEDVAKNDAGLRAAQTAAQSAAVTAKQNLADAESGFAQAQQNTSDSQTRADAARRQNQTPEQLAPLDKAVQDAADRQNQKEGALSLARGEDQTAADALARATGKYRDYMNRIFADAKQALEVHRRVIESLKQLQATQSASR